MPGPAPAKSRRRRNVPARGEWKATPGIGWQHGAVPEPPDGLMAATREAWTTWMRAWFASHWTPDDLPGLRIVITQYDAVERANPAKANDVTTLVRLMDTYGITPAGQQSRRWSPPEAEDKPVDDQRPAATKSTDPYRHLRAVS